MAMSRQSWSISALATEFRLDRRTVGRRLGNVAPCGHGPDGSPRWRLANAAPALLKFTQPPRPTSTMPEGCEILYQVPNPVHAGFVTAWIEAFVNFQPIAACALKATGLSRSQAEPAVEWLQIEFIRFAERSARHAGIPPWAEEAEVAWLPMDIMRKPEWEALEAEANAEEEADEKEEEPEQMISR
jgi:hypothetical protein